MEGVPLTRIDETEQLRFRILLWLGSFLFINSFDGNSIINNCPIPLGLRLEDRGWMKKSGFSRNGWDVLPEIERFPDRGDGAIRISEW